MASMKIRFLAKGDDKGRLFTDRTIGNNATIVEHLNSEHQKQVKELLGRKVNDTIERTVFNDGREPVERHVTANSEALLSQQRTDARQLAKQLADIAEEFKEAARTATDVDELEARNRELGANAYQGLFGFEIHQDWPQVTPFGRLTRPDIRGIAPSLASEKAWLGRWENLILLLSELVDSPVRSPAVFAPPEVETDSEGQVVNVALPSALSPMESSRRIARSSADACDFFANGLTQRAENCEQLLHDLEAMRKATVEKAEGQERRSEAPTKRTGRREPQKPARMIYEAAKQGLTLQSIADDLNQSGKYGYGWTVKKVSKYKRRWEGWLSSEGTAVADAVIPRRGPRRKTVLIGDEEKFDTLAYHHGEGDKQNHD